MDVSSQDKRTLRKPNYSLFDVITRQGEKNTAGLITSNCDGKFRFCEFFDLKNRSRFSVVYNRLLVKRRKIGLRQCDDVTAILSFKLLITATDFL